MKNSFKVIFPIFLLFIIVYSVYLKFIINDNLSILGFSCLKIVSGSMYPEITEGEKIIIKKCKDYKVGDIITFKSHNEIITHRIHSIDNGYYYTKGDYNNTMDLEPIEYNQIYGKVLFHFDFKIPYIKPTSSKYIDLQTFHIYGEAEEL